MRKENCHCYPSLENVWMAIEGLSAEKWEDLLLFDCHLTSIRVDFMFLQISCP
jgi:hypothetical protein